MDIDDFDLLLLYHRDGDEAAFARLVERHSQWIFAAARRRLGDDHLAEDATQAAFVVLASKAGELVESRRGSLSPWLFHVMHFTCARLRRDQMRQAELAKTAGSERLRANETAAPYSRLLILMEECIAQLPSAEREMIVGRFYRRQTFAQISVIAGISAEAVRKRVSRALVEIRDLMLRSGDDVIPDALLTDFAKPQKRIKLKVKETLAMAAQPATSQGGHQMISAEFLVKDVEANLAFFEKLGFPRRFIDMPDTTGRIPRASLTAGQMGKIWIRRASDSEIHPSPSINIFFWIDGGPDGLISHRKKLADAGVSVTPIIDEHGLPNFNVTTPDGYSIAFFTQYVPPGEPAVTLVK